MKRAPVQGEGSCHLREDDPRRKGARVPGTIDWEEHLAVFAARFGRDQSAERIAERGGFGYNEIIKFTGREPTTWKPRRET